MKQCRIALQWRLAGSSALCIPETEELLYEFMFKVKGNCVSWSLGTCMFKQHGQRIAVVGLFATAGQRSEFSVVSDLFHPFDSPKELQGVRKHNSFC